MRKMRTKTRFKEATPIKKLPVVEEAYKVRDLVLPILRLPNPCPIHVEISESTVRLFIGPRDYSWDRKTRELIGMGTRIR